MKNDLFEYSDYRKYLNDWILSRPKKGHGLRSEIAEALRCQVSYVSQILSGTAHLNLEQADALNTFIGHSQDESHFFILLIQRERAGTVSLKRYFDSQIQQLLQKRLVLKERVGVKQILNAADEAVYYSSWYYAAIHVALSIPELQTKEALAKRFDLPVSIVTRILEFLASVGLAEQHAGKFQIGATRLHAGDDSPMYSRLHANWRIKAMELMDKVQEGDLHYSSVVTMSSSDVIKLKAMLVRWITEAKALIRESKEEEVHCLSLDFFNVR